MKSLNNLYLIKIWKTPGIWIGLIFILIMLAVFPASMVSSIPPPMPGDSPVLDQLRNEFPFMVAGAIIATGISIILLQSWGYIFANIKTSDINRRIETSNITSIQYYAYAYIYSLLVFIAASLVSLSIFGIYDAAGLIQNSNGQGFNWSNADWGMIIASFIMIYLTSVSFATFVTMIVKDFSKYTTTMWIYVLLIFLIGGSSAPIILIRDVGLGDTLLPFTIISYMVPNVMTNFLMIGAFGSSHTGMDAMKGSAELINSLVPLAISAVFAGASTYLILKKY